MNRIVIMLAACALLAGDAVLLPADDLPSIALDETTRERCVAILREGMQGDDFWPAMYAAEGLTLAGYGAKVLHFLKDRLAPETDDQRRCGIARELVRSGDKAKTQVLLDILAGQDPYGHVSQPLTRPSDCRFALVWVSWTSCLCASVREKRNLVHAVT